MKTRSSPVYFLLFEYSNVTRKGSAQTRLTIHDLSFKISQFMIFFENFSEDCLRQLISDILIFSIQDFMLQMLRRRRVLSIKTWDSNVRFSLFSVKVSTCSSKMSISNVLIQLWNLTKASKNVKSIRFTTHISNTQHNNERNVTKPLTTRRTRGSSSNW